MNKYKIATIILSVILILAIGWFGYNYTQLRSYNQGFGVGQEAFYNQLVFNLQEKGFITLPIFQNNQTYQVNFYPKE